MHKRSSRRRKTHLGKKAKYEKDQDVNSRRAELNDMLENYYEEDKNVELLSFVIVHFFLH